MQSLASGREEELPEIMGKNGSILTMPHAPWPWNILSFSPESQGNWVQDAVRRMEAIATKPYIDIHIFEQTFGFWFEKDLELFCIGKDSIERTLTFSPEVGAQRQQLRKAIEAAFHVFVNQESDDSTQIASRLLMYLRIFGERRGHHQISVKHFRAIERNKNLLLDMETFSSEIPLKDCSLKKIKTIDRNGATIFSGCREVPGRGLEVVFLCIPRHEDLPTILRASYNTHEDGFSESIPGAIGFLWATIKSEHLSIINIQGLFHIKGPFALSAKEVRTSYRYVGWQVDLLDALFDFCKEKNLRHVSCCGKVYLGGHRNNEYFKEAAERKDWLVNGSEAQPIS